MSDDTDATGELLRLSAGIVAAYVGQNQVSQSALPDLVQQVYGALIGLGVEEAPVAPAERQRPAAPISRSVQDDYIICLEDGKKLKMLKRHLKTAYNMTPEEYRERWGLPADYPMVAPNYARRRSKLAKDIGLGTRGR